MFVAPLYRPAPLPTAAEIFARTRKAYDAVRTFEQDAASTMNGSKATARISFSRPDRLRVSGKTLFDSPYDLVSDGKVTQVFNAGAWQTVGTVDLGIAMITGISGQAGTLVPSSLLRTSWSNLAAADLTKASVAREMLNGRPVLRVQNPVPQPTTTWIDAKTGFVVKTRMVLGTYVNTIVFSTPKVNGTIPASRFKK